MVRWLRVERVVLPYLIASPLMVERVVLRVPTRQTGEDHEDRGDLEERHFEPPVRTVWVAERVRTMLQGAAHYLVSVECQIQQEEALQHQPQQQDMAEVVPVGAIPVPPVVVGVVEGNTPR